MNKKQYQMKDIMEKYNVSRDFIKYYEKKGLINPIRNESRYRLYDETELQKLKRIVDLRELGFSMDEIDKQVCVGTADAAIERVEKLRAKMESEIIHLNKKIEEINAYEKWVMENRLYVKQFKVDTDYNICYGCDYITPELRRNFYVRDIQIVHLTDDRKIKNVEEKNIVLLNPAEVVDETCKICKKRNCISLPKVYRGSWRTANTDEMEGFLSEVYKKAETLGYSLQNIVYCIKRSTLINGKDGLALDICIPFEE